MFGLGAALLALVGKVSFGLGMVLGFVPLSFALMGTVRRLFLPRFLELGQDALLISTGFLRVRVASIRMPTLSRYREVVRGRMTTIKLRTKERSFEINSILLPNMASYVAVQRFRKFTRYTKRKSRAHRSKLASIASGAAMKATARFTIPMGKSYGASKHCIGVRTIRMGCFDCPILLSMTRRTKSVAG